jgi:hypothetical protein
MLVQKFQMMNDRVIYMILVIYMIVTYDLLIYT